MKNLLFSLALFFSLSVYGQWIELDPGIEVSYFSDVYALSTDVAIVVGADGTILKTTDGGDTWEQKDSETANNLAKVQFATLDTGYIVGEGGVLLKTIDGGNIWTSMDTGMTENLTALSVVNENILFVAYDEHLLKSEDGGNSWQNLYYENIYINYYWGGQMQFFNSQSGLISSPYGRVYKTENGGVNWGELSAQAPAYFVNENIGFCFSESLLKSYDGGNSFDMVSSDIAGEYLRYIFTNDENVIWGILGGFLDGDGTSRGIIRLTSSDSQTYEEEIWYDNNTNIDMWAVHFANETTGYIVGASQEGAAIWKNSTGINEGLNVNEVEQVMKINIYPNPVSTELNILLDSTDNTTISIFDVSGQQIYLKSFNQKNIKINTSQFQKGVYILHVKTEQQNYSEKILIN